MVAAIVPVGGLRERMLMVIHSLNARLPVGYGEELIKWQAATAWGKGWDGTGAVESRFWGRQKRLSVWHGSNERVVAVPTCLSACDLV
jgi:hypothetical protein